MHTNQTFEEPFLEELRRHGHSLGHQVNSIKVDAARNRSILVGSSGTQYRGGPGTLVPKQKTRTPSLSSTYNQPRRRHFFGVVVVISVCIPIYLYLAVAVP